MKKIYTTLVAIAIASLTQAQNIDFSLSFLGTNDDDSKYEVALIGTPDFTETDGNSADIGAVISMSSNIFIGNFVNECVNSGPPNFVDVCEYPIVKEQWASTFLAAPSTASGRSVFQLLRTETGSTSVFFDAVAGEPIILAVFEINNTVAGLPDAGDMILVDNDDVILDGTFNETFFNINFATASGGTTQNLHGVNSPTASSINFASLSTSDNVLTDVSVFPNPVADAFTIKTANNTTIDSAKIYGINGRLVKTLNTETLNNAIDVSDLNTGVYFLQLTSGNANNTIKLLKQ